MRTGVLGVDRRLIHAGHERRAARGANGLRREDVRVTHAFGGEPIEVRRVDVLGAIAAEIEADVLADDPKKVRPPRFGGLSGVGRVTSDQKREREKKAKHNELDLSYSRVDPRKARLSRAEMVDAIGPSPEVQTFTQ